MQSRIFFQKEVRDSSPIKQELNDAYSTLSEKYKVKAIAVDLKADLECPPQYS